MYNTIFNASQGFFDVAEFVMHHPGCEKVILEVLRQFEVDTDRSVYTHELNALFDDRLMVGIVRRPKKSWFFVIRTFAVDLFFIRPFLFETKPYRGKVFKYNNKFPW